ncbi:hypothetical protein CTI12_AA410710 [Artemisia annua]|uniref:Uncharacterized protein n=1 Tax=Artemisia annua TaxID=35608 RepID=A0A2U1M7Q2_ARTAN|nr:hypothetical protein CTI12_AA410710 [Artemisia annua]
MGGEIRVVKKGGVSGFRLQIEVPYRRFYKMALTTHQNINTRLKPLNIKCVNVQNVTRCSVLYSWGSPDALDGVRVSAKEKPQERLTGTLRNTSNHCSTNQRSCKFLGQFRFCEEGNEPEKVSPVTPDF